MTAEVAPTVVVELTPPGRAAVAVVLVAGPTSREAIRQLFTPVKPWKAGDPQIDRIVFGRWGGAHGEEIIVCRREDDQFEIHCHGGAAAAPAVVEQLVRHGCQLMTWQDWLRSRGFESRSDSTTWAAQVALADAPTARTAAVLLDQYHGALSAAIHAAHDAVTTADWKQAGRIIDGILEFRELGLHLTTPWRVVLAGAPNVGKSSLMNRVAGFQRAIVSPLPGTTRDVVTITTAIDGWPVQLADTAGLRDARDELESAGIALAGGVLADADLVIVVADASATDNSVDRIASQLPARARVIQAFNKIDIVDGGGDASARCNPQSAIRNPQFVSALTGDGIAELIAAIGRSLVPVEPPAGAAIAFTPEQVASLEAARVAINDANASAAKAALAAMLAATGDEHAG